MPSSNYLLEKDGEGSLLFSGRDFQLKELIDAVLHLSNNQGESELHPRNF